MGDEFDIKAIRKRLGWTQLQMAAYLGVERSSISRMESSLVVSGPIRKLLSHLERSSTDEAQAKLSAAAPRSNPPTGTRAA